MKKLNKLMWGFALLIPFMFSNASMAQEKETTVKEEIPAAIVGVLDFVKIEKQSLIYQSYLKQKSVEDNKLKSRKKAMETELNKKGADIEKQKSLVSKDAFDKMVAEYKELANKYDLELRSSMDAYVREVEKAIITLNKATLSATEEAADKKNVNLVIPRKNTIFFAPAMNITDDVIAIMNQKSTKITFKPTVAKIADKK